MATIIFYEKPGCANNTRQKRLLTEAGHSVIAKSILEENWQAEMLLPFFNGLAVRDWFNYSAPAIKHGEIEPEKLDENQALALLLENHLLIRRPLMQVGNEYRAGFDQEKIHAWLGLTAINQEQDLETCQRPHAAGSCRHEQT
jgi:nitrogenase-associated protein